MFISSTINDLREYRDAAVDLVRKLGHQPIRMEDLEAVAEDALSVALKQIDVVDLFIVIVARRYGRTREDTGASMVETEFEHALHASKPILAFLLDDSAQWPTDHIESEPRLQRFRDRLTRGRIVSFFSSLSDFTTKLDTALRGWDAARRQSTSEVTLDDLPLAWRLVVASFSEPEFLRRPDPTAFVTAIEKWGEANKVDKDAPWPTRLEQARRALDNAQSGHKASALWLAWMQATRPMKAELRDQGDPAGARARAERALAISETTLGREHPDTAASLDNLAGLLRDQGDLAGARPLFERSLAIREKALGPEHPSTAASRNNLAGLHPDKTKPDEKTM